MAALQCTCTLADLSAASLTEVKTAANTAMARAHHRKGRQGRRPATLVELSSMCAWIQSCKNHAEGMGEQPLQ